MKRGGRFRWSRARIAAAAPQHHPLQFACVGGKVGCAFAHKFLPRAEAPQNAAAVQPGVAGCLDVHIAVPHIQGGGRIGPKRFKQGAGGFGRGLDRYAGPLAAHRRKQRGVKVFAHNHLGQRIGLV